MEGWHIALNNRLQCRDIDWVHPQNDNFPVLMEMTLGIQWLLKLRGENFSNAITNGIYHESNW